MLKVSELPGKKLLSLSDARSVGYIGSIWFDAKLTRAKTVEIFCDDDEYPDRSFVPMRYMQCNDDAAVVKSTACMTAENAAAAVLPNPMNSDCFNQSGKSLGKLRDVLLENNVVVGIVCDEKTFTPKDIVNVSENLCIFNDSGVPVKVSKPRPPRPAQKHASLAVHTHGTTKKTDTPVVRAAATVASPKEQPPQTQRPDEADEENGVLTPASPQSVTVTRAPGEPVKDYSFLLGKPVHSPVVSDGRVLIPAGTVVTEEVIERARREKKLVQLALRAF